MEQQAAPTPAEPDYGPCDYCKKPAQRYWRGGPVCWSCWHWYKLGSQEAAYWIHAIEGLFTCDQHGSGPDPNDYEQWNRWEMRDEVVAALNTLTALQKKYLAEVEKHKRG